MCVCQGVIKKHKHLLRERQHSRRREEPNRKKNTLLVPGVWKEINAAGILCFVFIQSNDIKIVDARQATPAGEDASERSC